jgi:hypothetical protein
MTILVIILFIVINIGIIVGLYFAFLRNLTPMQGYIALAILISLLVVMDVFTFDYVSKKIKKTMVEDISPEQCTKEYVQKKLNQLSKFESAEDKELLAEQLLQCFDDRKQIILIRHSVESPTTTIMGQPSKMALDKYLKSLVTLSLGDSIHIDLVENSSTGLIMYLELSEKQAQKK